MKPQLIKRIEIIDNDEEKEKWLIYRDNGAVIIDLEKKIDRHIIECSWIDEERKYIELFYSFMDYEVFAIVNSWGNLICASLREITEYIEEEEAFIVEICDIDEIDRYNEFFWSVDAVSLTAVINHFGNFIVEPTKSRVYYVEDEKLFFEGDYRGDGRLINYNGETVKFVKFGDGY